MFYQSTHIDSPDYAKPERGTDFSFPLHLHQCFEVIVLLNGEMQITVDTKQYCLHAGEALMIFPNQIHSLSSQKSEHVLCIFSPKLVKAYAAMHAEHLPENGQFLPDAYQINQLLQLSADASIVEKKALMYSLCAAFDRNAAYTERKPTRDDILGAIFHFVETEFQNDCSLMRLSKMVGHEYSSLSRYFSKAVGISYNTYVRNYRLSHACYLLTNTENTVLECALDSGYTNARSFNRHFLALYGITPSEYRLSRCCLSKR
jgi:AraC-like DNA-binding protein